MKAIRQTDFYLYKKPGQIGQSHESLDKLGYPKEIDILFDDNAYEIPKFARGALDKLPEAGSILHLGHLKIPYKIVEN